MLADCVTITEYVTAGYGDDQLRVEPDHPDIGSYLHWFHFANGNIHPVPAALATALPSFATSMPTNASPCRFMAIPYVLRSAAQPTQVTWPNPARTERATSTTQRTCDLTTHRHRKLPHRHRLVRSGRSGYVSCPGQLHARTRLAELRLRLKPDGRGGSVRSADRKPDRRRAIPSGAGPQHKEARRWHDAATSVGIDHFIRQTTLR